MTRGEEAVAALQTTRNTQAMEAYYDWVDAYVVEQYKSKLGVE